MEAAQEKNRPSARLRARESAVVRRSSRDRAMPEAQPPPPPGGSGWTWKVDEIGETDRREV